MKSWTLDKGVLVVGKVVIEDRTYWPWQVITPERNAAFGKRLVLHSGIAQEEQEAIDRATSAYNVLFTKTVKVQLGR